MKNTSPKVGLDANTPFKNGCLDTPLSLGRLYKVSRPSTVWYCCGWTLDHEHAEKASCTSVRASWIFLIGLRLNVPLSKQTVGRRGTITSSQIYIMKTESPQRHAIMQHVYCNVFDELAVLPIRFPPLRCPWISTSRGASIGWCSVVF